VSLDASIFEDSDDDDGDDDTTGFAPAVEEGPRKDANALVAFEADSDTAGASAGFRDDPASGADEAKVKGAVAPPVAPNPEKPPNFGAVAGC
jgi:hypothetical protein